jgi:Transposase IS200 like
MDYRYGSHTAFNIEYHFVWVTKYRYKVLKGDVAARLRELVRQTCEAFEIRILSRVVIPRTWIECCESRARLRLVGHASVAELERAYRAAHAGVERRQRQIIWLYAQCGQADQVAAQMADRAGWVRTSVKRYNAHGPDALHDGRHGNPGEPRRLRVERHEA